MQENNYIVPMFPYPSGYFHIGHARNYIFSDIIYRYINLTTNFKAIQCLGVDAFGLPAENAAIKYNLTASAWTKKNTEHIITSLAKIDIQYDEQRWVDTTSINFIRLNQFIFQILYQNNHIYQKETYQNWDPEDQTILSNEQVIDGKGWRSNTLIQKKLTTSWFIRISKYAERLKQELPSLKYWNTTAKKIQNSWMSHVNGYIVKFKIINQQTYIDCFTKQPEYISYAKFIAIAYTHELAIEYVKQNKIKINIQDLERICIKTNIKVVNPYNDLILDVYIAGYVLPDFGTKALYAAPEYDKRDNDFALMLGTHYTLIKEQQHTLIYDKNKIYTLKEKKYIYKTCIINLHDWCISRQRQWGCPIPIFTCANHHYNILIDDHIIKLKLRTKNYTELTKLNIISVCSECEQKTRSEYETLDTFFDSSWYYLAYLNANGIPYIHNVEEAKTFLKQCLQKLPIDYYIGGIEHANLHLIYTRVMIMILSDCLDVKYRTAIKYLINQGQILHKSYMTHDKQYIYPHNVNIHDLTRYKIKLEKMSKSKLNIISVDDVLKQYSSDSLRMALMSNVSIDINYEWDYKVIMQKEKFINSIKNLFKYIQPQQLEIVTYHTTTTMITLEVESTLFRLVQKYEKNIEALKIHNAISIIHEIFNLRKTQTLDKLYMHKLATTILLLSRPILVKTTDYFIQNILHIKHTIVLKYNIKLLD